MENENNATTSEQPEERKRFSATRAVLEGGASHFNESVVNGTQHYINLIQDAINPINRDDLPFVTAAMKIMRDELRKDLGRHGLALDKMVRNIITENGTECKRINHTVEIHTDEDGADELLRLLKRGLMPDALAKELAEAGYEKRGDAWVKRADNDGSEEKEEVD